jgi:hypothetical protein
MSRLIVVYVKVILALMVAVILAAFTEAQAPWMVRSSPSIEPGYPLPGGCDGLSSNQN